MDAKFAIVFKLLGHGLNSREHDTFVLVFGAAEQEVEIPPSLRKYEYQGNGLSLTYSTAKQCFWSATFSFFSRAVTEKTVIPFQGEVYAGIMGTDTATQVQQKIGFEPYYRTAPNSHRHGGPDNVDRRDLNSIWETYEVKLADTPPYTLDFIFDAFTERIKLLTISVPDLLS